MIKTTLIAVLLVLVLGGGFFIYSRSQSREMMPHGDAGAMDEGSYAYACDGGATLTMTPAQDLSTITLTAGAEAPFSGSVVLAADTESAGARFTGSGMVMTGAGEEIDLTVGSSTIVCNPVPNPDLAPFNWGDAGDGAGSTQPDASLVVGESIQGTWQSTDDPKFVRTFSAGDAYTDSYDGTVQSRGLWVAFTKANAPKVVPFPMEANAVYLQLTLTGEQADTLNFKVSKLTPDSLQLIYMDRGGALNFTRVQ